MNGVASLGYNGLFDGIKRQFMFISIGGWRYLAVLNVFTTVVNPRDQIFRETAALRVPASTHHFYRHAGATSVGSNELFA